MKVLGAVLVVITMCGLLVGGYMAGNRDGYRVGQRDAALGHNIFKVEVVTYTRVTTNLTQVAPVPNMGW